MDQEEKQRDRKERLQEAEDQKAMEIQERLKERELKVEEERMLCIEEEKIKLELDKRRRLEFQEILDKQANHGNILMLAVDKISSKLDGTVKEMRDIFVGEAVNRFEVTTQIEKLKQQKVAMTEKLFGKLQNQTEHIGNLKERKLEEEDENEQQLLDVEISSLSYQLMLTQKNIDEFVNRIDMQISDLERPVGSSTPREKQRERLDRNEKSSKKDVEIVESYESGEEYETDTGRALGRNLNRSRQSEDKEKCNRQDSDDSDKAVRSDRSHGGARNKSGAGDANAREKRRSEDRGFRGNKERRESREQNCDGNRGHRRSRDQSHSEDRGFRDNRGRKDSRDRSGSEDRRRRGSDKSREESEHRRDKSHSHNRRGEGSRDRSHTQGRSRRDFRESSSSRSEDSNQSRDRSGKQRRRRKSNHYKRNSSGRSEYSSEDERRYSRNKKGVPPVCKLTFDGKYFKGFMYKFKNLARKYDWTEEEKLEDLVSRLQDKALDYYSILSKTVQNDYRLLIEKLKKRFDKHHSEAMVRKQLASVSQLVDQDIREYAEEVMKLAVLAHPNSISTQEKIAIDALLQGCRNVNAASTVMNKQPKTFDDAVDWLEAALQNDSLLHNKRVRAVQVEDSDPVKKGNSTEGATSDNVAEFCMYLTDRMQQMDRNRNVSPGRSNLCYYCQKPGHMRRDCPERASPRRQESPGPQGNRSYQQDGINTRRDSRGMNSGYNSYSQPSNGQNWNVPPPGFRPLTNSPRGNWELRQGFRSPQSGPDNYGSRDRNNAYGSSQSGFVGSPRGYQSGSQDNRFNQGQAGYQRPGYNGSPQNNQRENQGQRYNPGQQGYPRSRQEYRPNQGQQGQPGFQTGTESVKSTPPGSPTTLANPRSPKVSFKEDSSNT